MQSDHTRLDATIRAALRLWITVAKTSGTHPSRLPECTRELGDSGPLTIREIEEYLDGAMPGEMTIPVAARMLGVSYSSLRRELRRQNAKPAKGKAYRLGDLKQAADTIRKRKARECLSASTPASPGQ